MYFVKATKLLSVELFLYEEEEQLSSWMQLLLNASNTKGVEPYMGMPDECSDVQ